MDILRCSRNCRKRLLLGDTEDATNGGPVTAMNYLNQASSNSYYSTNPEDYRPPYDPL
jgi:hypothetical protein